MHVACRVPRSRNGHDAAGQRDHRDVASAAAGRRLPLCMRYEHGAWVASRRGETDSATKPDDGTASTGAAIPAGTPRMSAADALLAERQEAEERRQEIRHTGMLVAIGTVLTLPVFVPMMLMLVSHSLVPSWLMNPWLQAILITPVMFYCGAPIHRVGWPALWHRSPDMNSLVALHHRRIPVQHRLVLRLGADARGGRESPTSSRSA